MRTLYLVILVMLTLSAVRGVDDNKGKKADDSLTCQVDRDCKPPLVCIQGKCQSTDIQVCRKACGVNEHCVRGQCVIFPCTELCKIGFECRNGICVDKCTGVVCTANQRCSDGVCVPIVVDPCFSCKPNQKCVNNRCVDKCSGVVCTAIQRCQNGVCVPIDQCAFCKPSEKCVNNRCVDKCYGVVCIATQRCQNGVCVPINPCEYCKSTQKCLNNRCVDKCFGVVCSANQRCQDGVCVPIVLDPCFSCKPTQKCLNNRCVDKCFNSQCPKGTTCRNGQCEIEVNVCPAKSQYQPKICTLPRPTICTLIFSPVCGVQADGTRVTYSNPCLACSNKSTVYTFNTTCDKAPFVCKPGESCLGYYCSSTGCKTDQQCPYDWQTCNSNKCVDKCTYLKCANCKYGICNYQEPNGNCGVGGKCRETYWDCYMNQCVDLCSHTRCPPNQVCKMGQCSSLSSCPKCPAGYQCVNSACVPIKCRVNSDCPAGTMCERGQCVLDLRVCPANSKYETKICTDPRPTQRTCPTINYFVRPYPKYCGVRPDGTRINFVEECSACKDTSVAYYFNTPCFKTPFVCKGNEVCSGYYCSQSCKDSQDCPYDWQTCSNNKCTDRCTLLRCGNCKYGICNYVEPFEACSQKSKCKRSYETCLDSRCVDLCSTQACAPNFECKNGNCQPYKAS